MDGRERGAGVVVVGQIGRDLVLRTDGLPEAGGSADVAERWEGLGGKGANQAVGLAQSGVPVRLVGVVGEDRASALVWKVAYWMYSAFRPVRREGVPGVVGQTGV
ncbi:pfkB family carbohydrate kinase [Kitasatospora sp. SolWspMP-SS2h]|uniref:PfkB family carbohydrate kinase n=1 Tax=Kitasatospora sp. SolWspMP-SS2h TaxID=1305729 RepID=UPI000DB91573|nr:PfkB family carbohydrate kinase [Kitasatospora sp. SolWspMP-SS2h]RAJ45461.1 pfkB family carbohydrate kinase [Kitasatospora sp. SolWspMP-SS2h]